MPRLDESPPGSADAGNPARMQLVLGDGTRATPALDQDLEDRLDYIVDNIVRPSGDPPP